MNDSQSRKTTRPDAAALPPPELATLPEIARWRAETFPDAPAASFLVDGERQLVTWSFAQLDERARRIAAVLQDCGPPGQRVLLLLDPGLDYLAAIYGCMYARAVAVPAYPPDPFRLNRLLPRLQAMVRDSGANALLANQDLLDTGQGLLRSLETPHCIGIETLDAEPLPRDWTPPAPAELGLLQYTSGSTGMPRGVMVTHANLLHNCRAMHAKMDVPHALSMIWLPPYHDMGLIGGLLLPLHSGRHTMLMSPLHFMQKPVRWLQAITRYRATSTGSPNFGLEHCVRKVAEEDLRTLDLSSVQVCVTGAERVRAETIDRFIERFGPCGFRREALMPAFGLAEATLMVTATDRQRGPLVRRFNKQALTRKAAEPAAEGAPLVSCGPPAKDVRVAIVDPQTRKPLEPGRIGEIWVHSPGAGVGYWNHEADTPEVFQAHMTGSPNGHVLGEGPPPRADWTYLRTGDLGFVLEGELFVAGRCKELVILSGRNYFPQDLEACVSDVHEALKVDGGAAFAVDAEQGEGLVVVQEVLRPRRWDLRDLAEQAVKALVDQFEVRPECIVLIAAGALPKTSSGKTRRQAARELYLSGSLHELYRWPEAAASAGQEVAAMSSAEQRLAAIWSDVLETPVADPRADFLALGGHSLEIAHLLFRLEQEYQVRLSPRLILEHTTLREMAVALAAAEQAGGLEGRPEDRQPWLAFADKEGRRLSFAEERFWVLDQIGAGGPLSHLTMQWTVEGEIQEPRLREALRRLVARHAALRTRFSTTAGEPTAEVQAEWEPPLQWLDWSDDDATAEDREQRWNELSQAERAAPLPLEAAPPWRFLAVKLGDRLTRFQWTVHHAICDGASLQLLTAELAQALNGDVLPEVAADFRSFAAWQRSSKTLERFQQRVDYWRDRLADAPRRVEFPGLSREDNSSAESIDLVQTETPLPRELAEQIRRLAPALRVTPHLLYLGAWFAALRRWSGQPRLSIAAPASQRDASSLTHVVGCLINTMVIAAEGRGEEPFDQWLVRLRDQVLQDWEHADVPQELLVEALQPPRSASGVHPLANVMFAYQEPQPSEKQWGDARLLDMRAHYGGFAAFDATLIVESPSEDAAQRLILLHRPSALGPPEAEMLLATFLEIVAAIARDPGVSLAELPPIQARDHQQLRRWNDTTRDGEPRCLDQVLDEAAEADPRRIVIRWRERQVRFAELRRDAERLARALSQRGVRPGDRVLVASGRTPETIALLWAIWKCGACYAPLDLSHPLARLERIAHNARARLAVLPAEAPHCRAADPLDLQCQAVVIDELLAGDPPPAELPFRPAADPQRAAYVMFTSGSTGQPKGVLTPHRALWNLLRSFAREPGFDPGTSILAHTTFSFDISQLELWLPLIHGGEMILADDAASLSAHQLSQWIAEQRPQVIQATPSVFRWLMLAEWLPVAGQRLWCGGEAMPQDLAADLLARGAELWNVYGPTETTVWSTLQRVDHAGQARLIGRPIENTLAVVVDADGRCARPGITGELCLAGLGLACGYLDDESLTAERFPTLKLLGEAQRFYRTGDLARWVSDGRLEFLGRRDQQVKVRGHRIELGEVETALREHPAVADACVAVRHQAVGDALAAYYVVDSARETLPSDEELHDFLQQRVPDYMTPSTYTRLEALPRSAAGKLDRAQLPAPQDIVGSRKQTPPASPLEKRIAAVWSDVLQRPVQDVNESFFVLGGHSLLAMQVFARLGDELAGQRPPIAEFYQRPTVAGLADAILTLQLKQHGEDAESLLAELESLSDEEANRLLDSP